MPDHDETQPPPDLSATQQEGIPAKDEATHIKRHLIETYLFLHRFRDIQSRDEIDLHFCMQVEGTRYDLTVQRAWIDLKSEQKIGERLDQLQVVPLLRDHRAAWVGVTASGHEVATPVDTDVSD